MPVDVRQLEKSYGSGSGRTQALRGINLHVDTGEFVAIVGTSGSGKTTLLNIIGGLDRSYDGTVEVDGRQLDALGAREVAELRNRSFGFVFQQYHLLDHLTALENVELPGYFRGGDEVETSPSELLGRVGLADRGDEHPHRLSGGEQQRVAIARALYGHPKHILCDEPTGNLDRRTGLQIMEVFQRLNREDGMTLIVVTHEEHIARMARRIVRLEDGQIVSDASNEPVQPSPSSIVNTRGAVSS